MSDPRFKELTFGDLLVMKRQVVEYYNEESDKEFLEELNKEINERVGKAKGEGR